MGSALREGRKEKLKPGNLTNTEATLHTDFAGHTSKE